MIFILSQLIVGVSVIYRPLMFVTLARDDRQSFIFEFSEDKLYSKVNLPSLKLLSAG
jgi:hypothetical protein